MIDAFVQLLLAVGQVHTDVIGDLPTEITAKIFRHLDEESLVSAASVNRRWKSVCKGDPILRRRVRGTLRKQKHARIQAYFNPSAGLEVTRSNPARMFGQRNGNVTVRSKQVLYEIPTKKNVSELKKFTIKKMDNRSHSIVPGNKKKSDASINKFSSKKVMRL